VGDIELKMEEATAGPAVFVVGNSWARAKDVNMVTMRYLVETMAIDYCNELNVKYGARVGSDLDCQRTDEYRVTGYCIQTRSRLIQQATSHLILTLGLNRYDDERTSLHSEHRQSH